VGNIHIINDNTMYQIYHLAAKLDKVAIKIPTSAVERPSKIYPNYDFWFENMPSGNPGPATLFHP
jgi:hypothetical protein